VIGPDGLDLNAPSAAQRVEREVVVRLSDPGLTGEFIDFLQRADCVADLGDVEAHAEGIAVNVHVPAAYDQEQARMEVALYLRVWEAVHPGSGAELLNPS
jgi:hypothetical protein